MASTEVEQKEGNENQDGTSNSKDAETIKKSGSKMTQEELEKMAKDYAQYLVIANHPEVKFSNTLFSAFYIKFALETGIR